MERKVLAEFPCYLASILKFTLRKKSHAEDENF